MGRRDSTSSVPDNIRNKTPNSIVETSDKRSADWNKQEPSSSSVVTPTPSPFQKPFLETKIESPVIFPLEDWDCLNLFQQYPEISDCISRITGNTIELENNKDVQLIYTLLQNEDVPIVYNNITSTTPYGPEQVNVSTELGTESFSLMASIVQREQDEISTTSNFSSTLAAYHFPENPYIGNSQSVEPRETFFDINPSCATLLDASFLRKSMTEEVDNQPFKNEMIPGSQIPEFSNINIFPVEMSMPTISSSQLQLPSREMIKQRKRKLILEYKEHFVMNGVKISRELFAKAFLQRNMIKAAKLLFRSLFTPKEISGCCLSGRGGTNRLDQNKIEAIEKHPYFLGFEDTILFLGILVIVWWMNDKHHKNPYSFDPDKAEHPKECEMTEVRRKAFIETRNEISRRKKRRASSSGDDLFIQQIPNVKCLKIKVQ